jgi:hypothetical protein
MRRPAMGPWAELDEHLLSGLTWVLDGQDFD